MRTFWFVVCLLTVIIASAQTYPDQGGAQVNQPFQRKVSGAVCFSGTGKLEGSAFFNFPTQDKKILAFVIGPAAPGQEKNDPFNGAGKYSNILITIKPQEGDPLSGVGDVVVNDDERSGSFTFKTEASDDNDDDDDDQGKGVASGVWDCGRKLKH
jgi:hypothetical protein